MFGSSESLLLASLEVNAGHAGRENTKILKPAFTHMHGAELYKPPKSPAADLKRKPKQLMFQTVNPRNPSVNQSPAALTAQLQA